MTNASSLFRSLIVYSICLPLAAIVGYLLATTPGDQSSFISIAVVLSLMSIPLFLRWHYPWMLLMWNASAILFFFPGRPTIGSLLVIISFGISMLQYILNRQLKFISVPMMAKPLLFILLVVLITARLTGGIGLNALGGGGGDNVGGKRYIAIILSVLGFFALAAVRIPPSKYKLYVFLFFAGALTQAIANLALVISPGFSFIFLLFPTDQAGINALSQNTMVHDSGIARLGGLSSSALAVISVMLAFYGLRGMLDLKKSWRFGVLVLAMVAALFGGYRSHVIIMIMTMSVMFLLEGLARTRLLPVLLLGMILGAAVLVPFTEDLPLTVQRSITFIPGIKLDESAVVNAQASTDWRIEMWTSVLPEVPKYLILGKGLGINLHDLDMERDHLTRGEGAGAGSAMAGDYHNGPLSVIIPFGLFGVAGVIWFFVAGTRLLYRNYKFGDPELLNFNRFFLAQFIVKIIFFLGVFGSFYGDLFEFVGIVGLSVALNHGVAEPKTEPVQQRPVFNKFRLANANAAR